MVRRHVYVAQSKPSKFEHAAYYELDRHGVLTFSTPIPLKNYKFHIGLRLSFHYLYIGLDSGSICFKVSPPETPQPLALHIRLSRQQTCQQIFKKVCIYYTVLERKCIVTKLLMGLGSVPCGMLQIRALLYPIHCISILYLVLHELVNLFCLLVNSTGQQAMLETRTIRKEKQPTNKFKIYTKILLSNGI